MLCQKCNKNEATIHMIKFINGEKTEIWMCEKCAKEFSEVSLDAFKGKKIEGGFQDILNGLFEVIDNNTVEKKKKNKIDKKIDIVCKNCGMTASKIRSFSKIGCSNCYNNFEEQIRDILLKYHGAYKHVGKIPSKIKIKIDKEIEINNLREELKSCISKEDYENAAILRDKINEMCKTER